MPPPTRRSAAGKGRGRGGERRSSVDRADQPKPKKRERERDRGAKRGGRGGVSSSSTSTRPTRAVTTVLKKLVVRNIPAEATEEEARQLLEIHGVGPESVWRFVPSRQRSNNRQPTPARLYLDMKKEPEKARKLIAVLNGQQFRPEEKDGDCRPLDVEFAPFQKIPREKQRKDAKVGTIDRDPEYVAFLEELSKPKDKLPSAEVVVDTTEGEVVEKPVAALVKYLNERKAHSREKGKGKSGKSLDKNARRPARKKDGSKQKGAKEKKAKGQKKTSSDAPSGQDLIKPRKQRNGKPPSKKEAMNQETSEPGVLCIMPKSTPVSGESPPSTTSVANRNAQTKGARKNAGRGRGGKKKDGGEGPSVEGAGSVDLKQLLPRRKGGNIGKKDPNSGGKKVFNKKESGNRAERKKKVFAPKDSTAQGTAAKS